MGDLGWFSTDVRVSAVVAESLVPAAVLAALFLLGLPVFAIRSALRGIPRDAETEQRGASRLVGYFLRHYFFWLTRPLLERLIQSGIPASVLTALSTLLGAGSGIAVARGYFGLGGWLFLFAGILDAFDGRLARAQRGSSPAGAAMDSILDRYTDSFILVGLAWYYRDSWVLLPVLLAFVGTSLVPYVRARGEGLGVAIRSGLMQRVERVLVLGGSVALSPLADAILVESRLRHPLAVAGVTIVAVTSNATAISRFLALMRALGARAVTLPHRLATRVMFSSIVATASDYVVVLALVDLGAPVPWATLAGCAFGSGVCFAVQRVLAYRVGDRPPLGRFAFATAMKTALNVGGVALLGNDSALDYRVAWWLTRGAVYLAWSLPLERWLFSSEVAPMVSKHA